MKDSESLRHDVLWSTSSASGQQRHVTMQHAEVSLLIIAYCRADLAQGSSVRERSSSSNQQTYALHVLLLYRLSLQQASATWARVTWHRQDSHCKVAGLKEFMDHFICLIS